MADYVQESGAGKVTTTTTTTTVGMTIEKPDVNTEYLSQKPGILKMAEIVLSLITFICAVSGCSYHSNASWTAFVSCSAFVICIILLIFALLRVPQDYPRLNWDLYELIFYALWTLFYFIAGTCMAALAGYYLCSGSAGSGSFFAFVCTLLFGYEAYLKFQSWRQTSVRGSTAGVLRSAPVPAPQAPNHPVP